MKITQQSPIHHMCGWDCLWSGLNNEDETNEKSVKSIGLSWKLY